MRKDCWTSKDFAPISGSTQVRTSRTRTDIGRGVRAVARSYRDAFEASKKAPKK